MRDGLFSIPFLNYFLFFWLPIGKKTVNEKQL